MINDTNFFENPFIDEPITEIMSDIDPEAVFLSEGSSRVVFINRDLHVVYKLAKSIYGIRQNQQEQACFEKYPEAVPKVHEAVTINGQDHMLLTVDLAYSYRHYIEQAMSRLENYVSEHMPSANIESVSYMVDILEAYPFEDKPESDPERIFLTQLQEYVEGTGDTYIVKQDVEDIVVSDLIVILEETHQESNFAHIIAPVEINLDNVGFEAMDDGSFIVKVIDAGIDDWDMFADFRDNVVGDSDMTIEYY